ncbi:DUF6910 family protein [Actinoplanes subglobosus]|uniref:DUF6910 family protein n=1 Tax=Actinoplanes subglobosus TaxID=1547892 RepID=A0ABV8IZ17_9ACTN
MLLEIEDITALTFDDGSPVRSASAIAPFGDGWLVAQDDAIHAAWIRPGTITALPVIDPVDGWETFSEAAGTKHLKPDFEAACAMPGGEVLMLGSGSSPSRMRASLVTGSTAERLPGSAAERLPGHATGSTAEKADASGFTVADLRPLYLAVATAFGLREDQLNLEGACLTGDRLHWFQRANLAVGATTASAEIEASALLAAMRGEINPDEIQILGVRRHDLGTTRGVALAVTDAVTLPDGRILVSVAAEDTPNAVDDGPVIASGLALLGTDGEPPVFTEIPGAEKVEGLAIRETTPGGVRLLAVVDADDYEAPSRRLALHLRW